MKFFNRFELSFGSLDPIDVGREQMSHADLLKINALALAARRSVDVEVVVRDSSTVTVVLPGGRAVTGSDWANLESAIARA